MPDDEGTRRWRRPERASTVSDALQLLRTSILEIRYLTASEATLRFGPGNAGGAIVITSRI